MIPWIIFGLTALFALVCVIDVLFVGDLDV